MLEDLVNRGAVSVAGSWLVLPTNAEYDYPTVSTTKINATM